METTAGQVLLNSVLPPRYRDHNRRFTKSTLNDLLARIATESPEEYPSVVKKLADVGRIAATVGGGYSFDIHHLRQTAAGQAAGQKAKAMVADILSNQALTPDQRTSQISAAISGLVPAQEKAVYQEALDSNNPLAMQVASGSRGNPSNLLGLIGAPLAYLDNQNRVIPRPVTHSYSQGMTPAQHWAATYGSRKGIVGTKISVADSGYAAKRLLRAAHQLVVTAHDDDEDFDPESPRGLPVPTDDMDSVGALLAQDVGPYKRDTIVSKKILNHLKSIGKERILVRSPTVGGPVRGGVSAKAAGLDEFGNLPGMNSAVGSNSANAISEVISQATLGAKHGGGAVTGKGDAVGGYGAINSLLEVPKQQAGGAEHAETDGRVTDISPASVGGYNVTIGGKEHYIAQGLEPLIKVGDTVEAGDVLSSGIPNPAMVVKHKGIGEGRRYFTKAMMGALKASNVKAFRRNVEMTSRGLIDHVRMNSEWGGYFPEDVVPYRTIEANWVPRKGSKTAAPESVVGQYLEKPVLHFSVGTKIRPSVIKDLKEFNVKHVTAHSEAPPFEPEMIRAMDNLSYDPDWMVRAYGSGVQKSFMDAAHRGMSSDTNSVSFVPALAKRVDFAQGRQVAPGIKPTLGSSGEMEVPKLAYVTKTAAESALTATEKFPITYVPREMVDSVKQRGLLSGEQLLKDPVLLAQVAASRGLTPEDLTTSIQNQLDGFKPDSAKGPNALFSAPDLSRLSKDHPLRRMNGVPVKIDVNALMRDDLKARFHGQELEPYDTYAKRWTPEQLAADQDDPTFRHHDLTSEEVNNYLNTAADKLWSTYSGDKHPRMYAPDVPHMAIISSTGKIDPKYLKFPDEPTAVAQPKLAYSGEYANNGYEEAASHNTALGALHSLDPEAVSTLTGTPFGKQQQSYAPQQGAYGIPGTAAGAGSPSLLQKATNFVSTPAGALTAGVGAAGVGYAASKAFRPSAASMAASATKAVNPSAYEAAAGVAKPAVTAAGAGAAAAAPAGLWSKAKMVGGKVIAPLGLAADAYGVGSNYYQGYQNNGMQGAYAAGHDAAMHRFDNLNSSNPLQVAGGVADLVYNAPQNVNLIAHGAIDTGRAAAETTKAVGNTYQTSKMTGTYNPMEAKRYHTPGQLLEEWKKSPYAPVEAATEQLYNIPAAAGAMANQAQVAQSEATRNRQLVTEINQKRVAQGLPPISDVPEWTGNRMADQAIESVTNRPTAVGSGFRQLMGGSGNAVNPVTGAPIRSIWSYFGK